MHQQHVVQQVQPTAHHRLSSTFLMTANLFAVLNYVYSLPTSCKSVHKVLAESHPGKQPGDSLIKSLQHTSSSAFGLLSRTGKAENVGLYSP